MKTSTTIKAAVSILALAGSGAAANADTLTAKFASQYSKSLNITSPVRNGGTNTVKFNWTRTDTAGPGIDALVATSFTSYCIDLAQTVSANTNYTFDVVTPVDHGFSASQIGLLSALWGTYMPSVNDGDTSAAFQAAVWEIVYDTDLNLTTGSFMVNTSGTARTTAQSWLDAISAPGFTPSGPLPQMVVLFSESRQDQITAVWQAVPTPGTAAVGAVGMVLMASRRRTAAR